MCSTAAFKGSAQYCFQINGYHHSKQTILKLESASSIFILPAIVHFVCAIDIHYVKL